MAIKREETHLHIEPVFRFETVRGTTTIKTAIYALKGETTDALAARITREQIAATYRAEQLEPVRRQPQREAREFAYTEEFDGKENRGLRPDRKPRNERPRY